MHDARAPALRWNTTYRRYSAPPMDGSPGKCECLLSPAPPWSKVPALSSCTTKPHHLTF